MGMIRDFPNQQRLLNLENIFSLDLLPSLSDACYFLSTEAIRHEAGSHQSTLCSRYPIRTIWFDLLARIYQPCTALEYNVTIDLIAC